MNLLESSFSWDGNDFDEPLIPIPISNFNPLPTLLDEDENGVDYQFFTSTITTSTSTSTLDLLTSSPVSFSAPPSQVLEQIKSAPSRPLILSGNLHQPRPSYASSIVRNPSPLKQMSSFNSSTGSSVGSSRIYDDFEIGLGVPPCLLKPFEVEEERDLLDESMNDEMGDRTEGDSIREMEERDMTPIKRMPKKWAIVSKARNSLAQAAPPLPFKSPVRVSRSRSLSPTKELLTSGSLPVDEADSSLVGFGASAYDLLTEEDSPDLLNELLDLTVAPISSSLYLDEDENESSLDMKHILRGLNAPSTSSANSSAHKSASRLSLANLNANNQQSGGEISPPRFASNLLASSTASYREYRDSPVRVISNTVLFDQIDEDEGEKTPMKARNRQFMNAGEQKRKERNSSEETEDTTGDMESMLREWKFKNGDAKTEEINAQATPTAFRHLNFEPTMTMELDLISPLQPIQPQPTSSSSSSSSSSSTLSNSPIIFLSKPIYSREVSLSPEMNFSHLQLSKPLGQNYVASNVPARNVLGVLNRIEARITTLAAGIIDTDENLEETQEGKVESGRERLRRKLEMMKNDALLPLVVPVGSLVQEGMRSTKINATPVRMERKRLIPGSNSIRNNRLPTSTSSSTLSEIYDDSVGATISTSRSSSNLFTSAVAVAPTPIKRIPRVSTSFLPSATPRLVPSTPRITPGAASRNSIFTKERDSERKDMTRERLEKAREERVRREEIRSPVKNSSDTVAVSSISMLKPVRRASSIVAPGARIIAPSASSVLASSSSTGRTTLEQALKTKPSTIASKYKFTPAVVNRSSTSASGSSRLPSTSTLTNIRQKSSSSSPPRIVTNVTRPPLTGLNGERKVSSSSIEAGSGLKRSGSVPKLSTSSSTNSSSTTGLKIPRSRTSLLPTASGISGIKRSGA